MNKKGIYDKYTLSKYIILLYEKKYNKRISSIKLQKSIYFLFAYWAGFNKKLNLQIKNGNEEGIEIDENEIYLFKEPNFQARQFGPVEIDIYNKNKEYMKENRNKLNKDELKEFDSCEKEISINFEAKIFIDNLLINSIFNISDFSLVNWSHKDISWNEIWNLESDKDKYISSEKIIEEYLNKDEY